MTWLDALAGKALNRELPAASPAAAPSPALSATPHPDRVHVRRRGAGTTLRANA